MTYGIGRTYTHKATGRNMVLLAYDLHPYHEYFVELTVCGLKKFVVSWSGTPTEFEAEWVNDD